jgi:hypothetical protein
MEVRAAVGSELRPPLAFLHKGNRVLLLHSASPHANGLDSQLARPMYTHESLPGA